MVSHWYSFDLAFGKLYSRCSGLLDDCPPSSGWVCPLASSGSHFSDGHQLIFEKNSGYFLPNFDRNILCSSVFI